MLGIVISGNSRNVTLTHHPIRKLEPIPSARRSRASKRRKFKPVGSSKSFWSRQGVGALTNRGKNRLLVVWHEPPWNLVIAINLNLGWADSREPGMGRMSLEGDQSYCTDLGHVICLPQTIVEGLISSVELRNRLISFIGLPLI